MPDVHNLIPELPEEVIVRREEEHAYGYIIEVLTRGLYHEKSHVIREYIQNGYDAVLEMRRKGQPPDEGKIQVRVEHPSIFIYDNGVGMDHTRISEYRYVGYSRKITGDSVGFRGIGKLSGISVADKIIVSTSPIGQPERYRLVFDAKAMLTRVEYLKAYGENISLNQLIRDYTSLEVDDEDSDAHYTLVELFNVHSDSQDLMDIANLREYLSLTAPVAFDPNFQYAQALDEELRRYVDDYDTVALTLNGQPVYKPFLPGSKAPKNLLVFPDDGDEGDKPIAFCWYCENSDKGQFGDKKRQGFFYRVKNFSVGDNQLPRVTLWKASPERAFYFFGEIHICDSGIIPSADRSNFEQNDERERLYRAGTKQISRHLNTLAGESSDERRARDFIVDGETIVRHISQAVAGKGVPKELRLTKAIELSSAVENVEKRLKNASDGFRERGENVVREGKALIRVLNPSTKDTDYPASTYDIQSELEFNAQATWVYDTIIEVLRAELGTDTFERIILAIHDKLGKV